MYHIMDDIAVATATDLRRRTTEITDAAEAGVDVVVQRGDEPIGVFMGFDRYQSIMDRLDRLESLELAAVAVARKRRLDDGEDEPVPLAEVIRRQAPELLEKLAATDDGDATTS